MLINNNQVLPLTTIPHGVVAGLSGSKAGGRAAAAAAVAIRGDRRQRRRSGSERLRRAANLALALVGLVASAPLMVLIAVLVKLSSPGPIFYVQRRVGMDRRRGARPVGHCRRAVDLGGRPFRLYKFRTMYTDADRAGEVWATPNDPRVTVVGRVLRRYRLDELPQLLNVLKGDMNVVGPRPEQPTIFARLSERIHQYVERQRVLPGITGWAQVNHHYDVSMADVQRKLEFDLEYMDRRSAGEDLRIVLRTLPIVLNRRGAW